LDLYTPGSSHDKKIEAMSQDGGMIESIVAFALSVVAAQSEAPGTHHSIAPPKPVSALVAPVLNAYDAVAMKDDESTEVPLDRALHKVLDTKTGYSDEALAILLGY
jgi:hypothetical protein